MKWYAFLPFLFIPFVVFCFYMASKEEMKKHEVVKLDHGRISKVEFEGHSYIVWQQNITDSILHDPNCECNKEGRK